uniref:Uncharacterized protein n=1 Tax=Glossina palpalis gambiensis TaxID=67801 RepID=A0A1B0BHJ4_9MUSC
MDVCTKTTLTSCGINEKKNGGQLYRVETASRCGFYRNVIDYHHCTFPSGITKQHLKLVNRNAVEERIYTIERHEIIIHLDLPDECRKIDSWWDQLNILYFTALKVIKVKLN